MYRRGPTPFPERNVAVNQTRATTWHTRLLRSILISEDRHGRENEQMAARARWALFAIVMGCGTRPFEPGNYHPDGNPAQTMNFMTDGRVLFSHTSGGTQVEEFQGYYFVYRDRVSLSRGISTLQAPSPFSFHEEPGCAAWQKKARAGDEAHCPCAVSSGRMMAPLGDTELG